MNKQKLTTFTLEENTINVLRAIGFDPNGHQPLTSINKADGKEIRVLDVTNSCREHGKTFEQNGRVFKQLDNASQSGMRTNDALPLRSALYIDDIVKDVYQKEVQMVNFVEEHGTHVGAGMEREKALSNMLFTVQRWDDDTDDGDTSTHDMMGRTANTNFNLSLEADIIPMPLQHIEMQYTVRDQAAFESGQPTIMFDETLLRRLVKKMARQKELMVIGGTDLVDTFTYAGHSLYGFRSHTASMTTTYTEWESGTSAADILTAVRLWIATFAAADVTSKLTLFLPTNVETFLMADYQDTSSITILDKIKSYGNIEDVIFLKYLPDDEIIMFPKDDNFYGYFQGFDNTVYNWTNGDQWVKNFKLMNLKNMVFRPSENVTDGFLPCLVISPAG